MDEECDIGRLLSATTSCHSREFTTKQGKVLISTLQRSDQELLQIRTRDKDGVPRINPVEDVISLCHHHHAQLITRYVDRQRVCVDPLKRHKSKISKSLRGITMDNYIVYERKFKMVLNPGDKLCSNCLQHQIAPIQDKLTNTETQMDEILEDDVMEYMQTEEREKLNMTLNEIDCSPMKSATPDAKRYGQKKLERVVDKLKSKMADVQNVEVKSTSETDIDYLVQCMKEKLSTNTDHRFRLRVLTLAPKSWSYEKVMRTFQVGYEYLY